MNKNKESNCFNADKYYIKNKRTIYLTNFCILILLGIILYFTLPEVFYQNYLSKLELLWAIFGIELTVFVFIYSFIRKNIYKNHRKIAFYNSKSNIDNKYVIIDYKSYFREMNLLNIILWDIFISSFCLIIVTFLALCNSYISIIVKIIISVSISILTIGLIILVVLILNCREVYYNIEKFFNKKDKKNLQEVSEYLKLLKEEEKENGKDENAE